MNLEPFRRLLKLKEQRAALDAQVDELKAQISELESILPDVLAENGLDSMNLDGHTLYCQNRAYAKAKEGDYTTLTKVMHEHGFGDLCTISSQKLNSLWREFEQSDEGVPQWLREVAEREPAFKLATRKQPKKKK